MISMTYFAKCVLVVVVLWFIILALLPGTRYGNDPVEENHNMPSSHSSENIEIFNRIDQALQEINVLKRNNAEMKLLLAGKNPNFSTKDNGGLSLDYEKTRRLLEIDLKEFWYYVKSKADNIGEEDMTDIENIYKQLRSHIMKLRASDGYEDARRNATESLSNLVQTRIRELQNPKDCSNARKLVCTLNKGCGFGCQIHHLGYCLIMAYATSRTLILDSKNWRYNRGGWETIFLPVSDSCTTSDGDSHGDWASGKKNVQVLQLPIVDFLKPRPPYLPVAIPSDIAEKIEAIHGEPHIWWVSQFMKYLLRLQPNTNKIIEESKAKLGFNSPVVGLHIRRTDKIGTEASFHSLKEYMNHAEQYYDILQNLQEEPVKRRVFIASDDPSVISEASKKYPSPDWEILADRTVAQSASLSQRYNAVNGIIQDIFLLAECDFVICTFSSQVCRLAYELMQARNIDTSQRFISLDDIYYYGGGIGLDQVAVKSHDPRNAQEIELKPGDKIAIAGNHWNGFSKGTNRRTNKMGLYPSYKARDQQHKVDFPVIKWWNS